MYKLIGIYIYIYIERERGRDRDRGRERWKEKTQHKYIIYVGVFLPLSFFFLSLSLSLCHSLSLRVYVSLYTKKIFADIFHYATIVYHSEKNLSNLHSCTLHGFFAGPSSIRAGWGPRSMIDSRLNGHCIWPGQLWMNKQSLTRQQSTKPSGHVQAMSRHKCQIYIALSESKFWQGHLAHIEPSEPMINIVQQGMSLSSWQPSPFPKIPTIKKIFCQILSAVNILSNWW